jgi:hypothetical protein
MAWLSLQADRLQVYYLDFLRKQELGEFVFRVADSNMGVSSTTSGSSLLSKFLLPDGNNPIPTICNALQTLLQRLYTREPMQERGDLLYMWMGTYLRWEWECTVAAQVSCP